MGIAYFNIFQHINQPHHRGYKYDMIKNFSENFSSIKDFDKPAATKLKDFFDINFVSRDIDEYRLYFQNLKTLAYQNLGLAHCVVHNQSAQNVTQLAYDATKFPCYLKPYGTHIGAYSFRKPARVDNLILDGNTVTGVKKWASQLHNADFLVIRILDTQEKRRWIFLDLDQAPQKITNSRDTMLGMQVARASDIEIDIELPEQWIVDNYVSDDRLQTTLNFHNYGLITNYMSNARALLDQTINITNKHGYNVDHCIRSLDLQVRVLESLWIKNIDSTLEPLSPDFWQIRDCQYQFGKKTLIDIIHLCLQVFNSHMFDMQNPEAQAFRDALIFSSHITNLYRNLETGNTDF